MKIKITSSKTILILTVFILVIFSPAALAQIDFTNDVDDETPAAPIDMFICLGMAAGSLYGIRKIKK